MLKFCYDHRGSISIFLLVIIVVMLIFSFMALDIAKINLATAAARNNTDLAGNAALTDYDKILRDAYGLFANSKDMDELSKNVSEYYIATMSSRGITVDNGNDIYNVISELINGASIPENNNMLRITTSPLTLEIGSNNDGILIQPINESAISNPTVMRHQIVEYMKYRAPVSLAAGMLEKINVFKDISNQTAATTDRIEYEDALNVVQNCSDTVYDIMKSYTDNLEIVNGGYKSGTITYGTKTVGDVSGKATKGIGSLQEYYNELVEYTVQISPLKDYIMQGRLASKKIKIKPNNTSVSNLISIVTSIKGNSDYAYLEDLYSTNKYSYNGSSQLFYSGYDSKSYDLLKTMRSLYNGDLKNGFNGTTGGNLAKLYVKFYELYYGIIENQDKLSDTDKETFKKNLSDFKDIDDIFGWAFGRPVTTAKSNEIYDKGGSIGAIDYWAEAAYMHTQNALNDYSNCFYDIVAILYYQEAIAEFMGGSSSPLDDLKKAISEAKTKSDEWSDSISKVETESYKASMENTHKAESENFDNLDPDAVERLKADFRNQAEAYGKDRSIIEDHYGIIFGNELYSESKSGSYGNNSVLPAKNYDVKYRNDQEVDMYLEEISVSEEYGYSQNLSNAKIQSQPSLSVNSAAFLAAFNSGTNKDIYDIVKKISEKNIIASKDDRENMKKDGENAKNAVNEKKEELSERENSESEKTNSSTRDMSDVAAIVSFNDYIQSNLTTVPQYGASIGGVDIGSMDADEKGNYDTSNVTNLLSQVGQMFANLAEVGRDNLFIAEYLTGMFSCMTTGVKDGAEGDENAEESMAGYVFSKENNLHYQAELEYILYGQNTEFANKAAAVGTISAIRFVLNLIYSFTDSEINAFTSSTASALGAVFPFAIPVIKTVLHILLSAAETSWDMIELSKGNSVPIYKTQKTWVCKATNIIGTVVEEAVDETAKKLTKELEDGISDFIDGKTEDITDWVKKMTDEKEKELESILSSKIITPLNEAVTQLTADTTKSLDEIEGELNNLVDKIISDITNSSAQETEGDSILSGLYSQMSSYLSSQKNEIVGKIKTLITNSKANAQSYVSNFETKFSDTVKSITDKINTVIKSAEGKIKEAVTSAAEEVKSFAVKGVNTASDKLLDAVNSKISSKLSGTRNVNINMGTTSSSGGNKILDSLLCMSYKDYLYLFLILGLINGSETELTRAAQLMQCNIQHRGQTDYDINKSVTMFNVYSASKVKTSVMGRYADSNGFTMKNLSDGYYNIEIRSFVGY